MTIKQQGGIFGRNPTFNDVGVEGDLTLSGSLTLPNDSISGDAIDGGSATLEGLTVGDTSRSFSGVYIISSITGESELRMGDTDTDAGSIAYRNDTNEMTFRTNAAPRATLDGSGNFEPTGNVVLANGKGIDFSATSDASGSTSELLDDYEQGTFTASLTATTSGTITLDYNRMSYTKVGRLVHCQGEIRVGSLSSPTGDIELNGLPYASTSDGQRSGRLAFAFEANTLVGSPSGTLQGKISTTGTTVSLRLVDGDVFTSLSSLLAVNTSMTFSFCYVAD